MINKQEIELKIKQLINDKEFGKELNDLVNSLVYKKDDRFYIDSHCSKCNTLRSYSTKTKKGVKTSYKNSIINQLLCSSCSQIGRKHSSDTLIKMSKNNGMNNPEYRKKASEGLKKKWSSGEMEEQREKARKLMIDNHSNRRYEKSYINSKSKPEIELYEILKITYPDIIQQKTVKSKHFDLYIPSLNLLIEYNGDYWHCNPEKYESNYFNKKKNKFAYELWEYDKNKLQIAKDMKYLCIVIWESEFKKNKNIFFELLNKINE